MQLPKKNNPCTNFNIQIIFFLHYWKSHPKSHWQSNGYNWKISGFTDMKCFHDEQSLLRDMWILFIEQKLRRILNRNFISKIFFVLYWKSISKKYWLAHFSIMALNNKKTQIELSHLSHNFTNALTTYLMKQNSRSTKLWL